MINIELDKKQIAYVMLALNRYESELLNSEDEDMGDELGDLIMIQNLKHIFKNAKDTA